MFTIKLALNKNVTFLLWIRYGSFDYIFIFLINLF